MGFNQAIVIAMRESEEIVKAVDKVRDAVICGEPSPCYFFAIDGRVFYFGFDGVDLHAHYHSAPRSAELIARGEVLVIR